MKPILLTISTVLILSGFCSAQNAERGNLLFSALLPSLEENLLSQPISYELLNSRKTSVNIHVRTFHYSEKDSLLVYDILFKEIVLKEGAHNLNLLFAKADNTEKLDNDFVEVVKKFGITPAGTYKIFCTVTAKDTSINYDGYFIYQRDSTLSKGSGLRNKITNVFADPGSAVVKATKKKAWKKAQAVSTEEINKANDKLDRKLGKQNGITTRPVVIEGKAYSELYYKKWFLGRYELASTKDLKTKAASEVAQVKNNVTSLVSNDLLDFTSVQSQVKELFKQNKEDKTKGDFDLDTHFSNDQEPNSGQDNNYTELHGAITTKLSNVPVLIEGYYTTQDKHREAKASYIRIHYDVEEAKSELAQQIAAYKTKFNQAAAKGKGLDMIYSGYINSLNSEKQKLVKDIEKEYGIDHAKLNESNGNVETLLKDNIDTTGLTKQLADSALTKTGTDSSAAKTKQKLTKTKTKLTEKEAKLKAKYERLMALEQKIEKYYKLLQQYKDQLHLDSAATYSKLEQLSKGDEASYKQMAKAAAGLLPEGKVKKFATGLTNLDAGILNKYESAYTMAGQNLKGLSVGYDLGFSELGVTVGSTQYVSRDGTVDKYTSYLGRLNFKPIKGQKISLIYCGYTPSTKMLAEDDFFKDVNIALPGFRKPVHIVSLDYDGKVTKNILIHSEGASSFRGGEKDIVSMDKAAIKTSVDYILTKANAALKLEWENMGRNFENSALPIIKTATERYTLATQVDLFKSFLTLGVQYNYLMQQSFASTGYSTKWGFDIKTHSKRYPSMQLSYKPFSTFRTYSDTLTIAQRPLTGEVWIGKASYQIKIGKIVHRFMAIYNQNASGMDSVSYNSKMVQLSYILAIPGQTIGINAGWMSLPALSTTTSSDGYSNASSYFINTTISKNVSKHVTVNGGIDGAIAKFGLQKAGVSVGVNYRFEKLPIAVRVVGKYADYKLSELTPYKSLIGGQVGVSWHFAADNSLIRKKG